MRFIHTADWHLGNYMHGIDRVKESSNFLAWLKGQIIENDVEALVIAGDVFDTANPSNGARGQYFRFLASLLDTCCKNVLIVGGNHDSGAMLDTSKEILEALNIQVVGSIWDMSPESLVRELKKDNGEVFAICAMVPYAREPELRGYVTDDKAVFADNAYKGLYAAVFEAAEKLRNGRNIPVIATGHLYAANLEGRPQNDNGENMRDSGVRDIVGNLGTVTESVFPDGFDYVALGHIHYSTTVAKNAKIRYSGSPFVLGFDEARMPHHVLMVDVERGSAPVVKKIETPRFFDFVRVCGSVNDIRSELVELAGEKHERPVKVEIVYDYEPGMHIRESLGEALNTDAFEVVSWKTSRKATLGASVYVDDAIDSVDILGDEEIFRRLILTHSGEIEMTEELEKTFNEYWPLFKTLLDEVEKAEEGK